MYIYIYAVYICMYMTHTFTKQKNNHYFLVQQKHTSEVIQGKELSRVMALMLLVAVGDMVSSKSKGLNSEVTNGIYIHIYIYSYIYIYQYYLQDFFKFYLGVNYVFARELLQNRCNFCKRYGYTHVKMTILC